MISCIVSQCSWKSNSMHRFYDHLNKFHEKLPIYACNHETCTRRFSIRYSFFRHFKRHFTEEEPVQNEIVNNDYNINEFGAINSENAQPLNGEESRSEQQHDDEFLPGPSEPHDTINMNAVLEKMENLSLDFNLKWLNTNSMPRKTVFEVNNDIQTKILKPFKEVSELMQVTGLISMEGKQMFDKMFESLGSVNTEYKCVQKLKSADLYQAPKEFVISNELRPGVSRSRQTMDSDPITG